MQKLLYNINYNNISKNYISIVHFYCTKFYQKSILSVIG